MSIIALLNSFFINLDWLALRYFHLRKTNLFKRSINVFWSSSKEVVFLRVNYVNPYVGPGMRDPGTSTWEPSSGTRHQGSIGGTWDSGPGILHLGPFNWDPGPYMWEPGPNTFTWNAGPIRSSPYIQRTFS